MNPWMGLNGHKYGNAECFRFLFKVMWVDSLLKLHIYCMRPLQR